MARTGRPAATPAEKAGVLPHARSAGSSALRSSRTCTALIVAPAGVGLVHAVKAASPAAALHAFTAFLSSVRWIALIRVTPGTSGSSVKETAGGEHETVVCS